MADDKKYPAASDEIKSLLGLGEKPETTKPPVGETPPPENLPFMEIEEPDTSEQEDIPPQLQHPLGAPAPAGQTSPMEQLTVPAEQKGHELYGFFLSMLKSVLPYVVIFAIGLGLYFFFFSDFSFTSLLNRDRLKIEDIANKNQNKELKALQADTKDQYLAWMRQFFFDVNDEAIISMDTDVSGNGLTNYEKYLLNLNPKVYSTRGDVGDGEMILQNLNPWTGKPLSDEQKQLVEKYINRELVSNRITAAALTRGVTKFAQYVNPDSPYYIDPQTLQEAGKQNQAILSPEAYSNQQAYQTATTVNQASAPAPLKTGTQIDESVPGRLDIPANNISVPLIWTQNVNNFEEDLKKGTVHYPGTALPGEIGTSYISGHSSGYLWDKSPYKQIFAVLGQVKDGTSFTITAQQNDGKKVVFHYVIQRRGEYAADDQAQFISTADSVVALSTCWPVGTTDRRLVLFAKLTQTDR